MDEEAWLKMALTHGWLHAKAGGPDTDAWHEKVMEQGGKTARANMKLAADGKAVCTYCGRSLREGEAPFDAANPPPASHEENLRSKRWHLYGSGRVICPECFPAKEWRAGHCFVSAL